MKKIGFIFILLLILITSGCNKVQENNEIKIGIAWPFLNNIDLFEEGVDLALEEINKNGGINGKELVLIKKDDAGTLTTGMSVAHELVEINNIKAVVGHKNSFVSIPVSTIYEEAGIVMLSPASTAPELTEKGYSNVFRIIPDDNQFAEKIASYIAKQGHKQMVIYYTKDSYGIGLANSFEDKAKEFGITIVDRFNYFGNKEDLSLLERRWNAFGYDGIFLATTAEKGTNFINAASEAGIEVPYFAGNSLDSDFVAETTGNLAEGLVVASVFDKDGSNSSAEIFVSNFKEKYDKEPDSYAALGYDALHILASGINKQLSEGSENLASELKDLEVFNGVTGEHRFNEKGNEIGDAAILKKIVNGQFEIIE